MAPHDVLGDVDRCAQGQAEGCRVLDEEGQPVGREDRRGQGAFHVHRWGVAVVVLRAVSAVVVLRAVSAAVIVVLSAHRSTFARRRASGFQTHGRADRHADARASHRAPIASGHRRRRSRARTGRQGGDASQSRPLLGSSGGVEFVGR